MVLACFGSRLMPAEGDAIGPEFILEGLGKQAAGRGRGRFVLCVFLSMISREFNPRKSPYISGTETYGCSCVWAGQQMKCAADGRKKTSRVDG